MRSEWLDAFASEDRGARAAAFDALLSARPSPEALEAGLASPIGRVAFAAALAHERLHGRRPALISAALRGFSDADPDIRWAACELVERLLSDRPADIARVAEVALEADAQARMMALYCLRARPDAPTEVFIHNLSHADPKVRRAAMVTLARSAAFSPECMMALRGRRAVETDPRLRRLAIAALERRSTRR